VDLYIFCGVLIRLGFGVLIIYGIIKLIMSIKKTIPYNVLRLAHLTITRLPHLSQEIALQLAEQVLPIFENEYPNDNRPRQVITAARRYFANPTIKKNKYLVKKSLIAYNAVTEAQKHGNYYAAFAAYAAYWAPIQYGAAACYAAYAINIDQWDVKFQNVELKLMKSDSWVQL
jgi:hypothetical protein